MVLTMENNLDIKLKILDRKVENDGFKEYCRVFPIFSNLEEKCSQGNYGT